MAREGRAARRGLGVGPRRTVDRVWGADFLGPSVKVVSVWIFGAFFSLLGNGRIGLLVKGVAVERRGARTYVQ